ncbi:MAG: A/G-specific adenine glycosylase, partial [Gemmatimonadetes bacterium]|nr:A/G-specific adenine glycosylase [Gemmatimonadota bacterium]
VETVGPYYARWLQRFPDWDALAAAPLDDVLLAWEGLGYYSRARNLHRTARAVRERHGGELPADPAALRTLPGVGEYTAGAVASIAFGLPVPAVDGNVRRVLARLLDLARPTPAQLRREAARLLDPERPGDHNEAMMELGATICTPRAPRCGECPVAAWCAALAVGTVAKRPGRRPRRGPVPRVDYSTLVAIDPADRILLARRPEEGLLAGMWEFPSGEVCEPAPDTVARSALQRLAIFGACGRRAEHLASVQHAFTHLRATYHPVVVRFDRAGSRTLERETEGHAEPLAPAPEHAWIRSGETAGYALPVAQQKIARLVEAWLLKAGDQ